MIRVEGQSIKVTSLDVRGAAKGKDGAQYTIRVGLEHEPETTRGLPECQSALDAVLREQSKRSDNAKKDTQDVITVRLKRDLPRCRYVLGIFSDNTEGTEGADIIAIDPEKRRAKGPMTEPTPMTHADFLATVAGQPSIAAIHGELKVAWKVDAFVDEPTLVALARMVKSDWVAGTIAPCQGDLNLEAI